MTYGNVPDEAADTLSTGNGAAWLLVPPEDVPERWQHRAVPASLLPLLPDELSDVLSEGRTYPRLDEDDVELARLVAAGIPTAEIARRLHLARRTVYRRIADLRRELGVGSTVELVAELARKGF